MYNTDLIDRYLHNELDDQERAKFEALLSSANESAEGKQLREELELQKEIIRAIQLRGLKESLKQKEAEMRQKRNNQKKLIQQIIRISSWGGATSLAAAALAFAIILTPMAQTMESESLQYAQSITVSPVRGSMGFGFKGSTVTGNTYSNLHGWLVDIQNKVAQEQFDEAYVHTQELIEYLQESSDDISSEVVIELQNEAEWLLTICKMNKGQVISAKRLLKKISTSNSPYAQQAQEILNKL